MNAQIFAIGYTGEKNVYEITFFYINFFHYWYTKTDLYLPSSGNSIFPLSVIFKIPKV